jgi:hypothetical protein
MVGSELKTRTNLLVSITMNRSSWKSVRTQPVLQRVCTPFGFHEDKCESLLQQKIENEHHE